MNVFLSYARRDAAMAQRIRRALDGAGMSVWSDDEDGVTPGEDWKSQLLTSIRDADTFVLALPAEGIVSPWVILELGAAWGAGKRVIVVTPDPRVADQLPIDPAGVEIMKDSEVHRLADLIRAA